MLFYIIFDRYSLLQAETLLYCDNLKKKHVTIEIVCLNVSEVGNKSSSLSECLDKLIKISNVKGKRLHVFIDEYDSEELTENECTLLTWVIDHHFRSSYLVIVMQSICKHRSFHDVTSANRLRISTHRFKILEESMKFLNLTKVMRFTESIFDVNKLVQSYVSSKENRYAEPRVASTSIPQEKPAYDFTDGPSFPPNQGAIREMPGTSLGNARNNIQFPSINSVAPFDRLIKQANDSTRDSLTPTTASTSDLLIGTKFEFYKTRGCGHAIKGSVPSLIRIPYNKASVNIVASAILEVSKPRWERSLFICGDLRFTSIVSNAVLALNLELVSHLGGLTQTPLEVNEMVKLYNKWIKTAGSCVLLTDNLGCRGLQNENVFIFVFFILFYVSCYFCFHNIILWLNSKFFYF